MDNYFTWIFFDNFRFGLHSVGEANEFNGCEAFANRVVCSGARRSGCVLQKWCADCRVIQLQIIVGAAQRSRLGVGRSACADIIQARILRRFTDADHVSVIFSLDLVLFAHVLAHIVPSGTVETRTGQFKMRWAADGWSTEISHIHKCGAGV